MHVLVTSTIDLFIIVEITCFTLYSELSTFEERESFFF